MSDDKHLYWRTMVANEVAVMDAAHVDMPMRTANPMDIEPAQFKSALSRRGQNRNALIEWVRGSLVDGVDFGAVPLRRGGFSKPSLRKPGAEKICGMLGVTATFPTLKDYEQAALEGKTFSHLILRCHLLSPDGQIVADGVGARSLEQDYGDMNKCLKMAIKSAHIDATLRMAGLSEIFTQDLEDMPKERFDEGEGSAGAKQSQQRAHTAPTQQEDPTIVPRGKHQGKKWIEVPMDYLQWAVGSDKAPQALRNDAQREIDRRDLNRGLPIESEIPN